MPLISPILPAVAGIGLLAKFLKNRRGKKGGGKAAAEALAPEQKPGVQAPDVEGTLRPPGEEHIQELQDVSQRELEAQQADFRESRELKEDVERGREETVGAIEEVRGGLEERREGFQQRLGTQQEELQEIPQKVQTQFEQLRTQFGSQVSGALGRHEAQRSDAMGQVFRGQSAAMQAAVEGIQGNIRDQVAQIQGNPDIPGPMKSAMIAKVKMQGAMSMAPAIGQTVLQFNKLAADTATNFANVGAQIEATGLRGAAALTGAQGQAFAQAQTAVGQLTNNLLDIEQNAEASFANSQAQLLSTRSMAENASNDIMLRTISEFGTPYADFTNATGARLQFENEIMTKQFAMSLQEGGFNLQVALAKAMEGTPLGNMFQGFLQGFAQKGLAGGLVGGAAGFAGSLGPSISDFGF
jgi:hypothetical protein